MTTIKTTFGEGGKNLAPRGSTGLPTLAETLRDIADDLAGIKSGEATSPDATDLATAITLVNELKGIVNALYAYTVKTVKG